MKKILFFIILLSVTLFGKELNTDDVIDKINDPNWILVDTRDTNEYNGWDLSNLKVEGHICGATDFSYKWLTKEKLTDKNIKILKERIKGKGLLSKEGIILYGTENSSIEKVASFLKSNGVKNINFYNLKSNSDYKRIPFTSYKNYELLVPATWVKQAMEEKKIKIFETSWGSLKDDILYLIEHIPGAPHINTDSIEPPPKWMINTDENLIKFAQEIGVAKDDSVVLYGDDVMASYRVAIILKYLGVKDVRVLNGGLQSWKEAGYATERGSIPYQSIKEFGSKSPINKEMIINIDKAKNILNNNKKDKLLVDIRSYNERIGKESGYSYMDRKGRIPGSVWGKGGTSSTNLIDYRNIDNTMRNGYEIISMWKELGIDPNKELSFFCGSGWRAAEVLYYSQVMGFRKNSLYSNGWMEWSEDKNNPIELGKER